MTMRSTVCGLSLLAVLHAVLLGGAQLLAQTANASTKNNVKAAVRGMRTAITQLDAEPQTGERAVLAISEVAAFDGKPAAVALLDAAGKLASMAAPIIEKRRKGLEDEGGSGRLKRSRYELRNVDDAAEAVAVALGKLKSSEALTVMLARLTDQASTLPLWLRLQLAARIAELPEVEMTWRDVKKQKSPETLLALIATANALGSRAGKNCGTWLAAQLSHLNPDVRKQAAQALAVLAWAPAIELLIARIEQEHGPGRDAVLAALTVLTGQDPGDSVASWQAWLQAEGGPYVRGEKPLSKGTAAQPKRRSAGNTVVATYFGIEQTGDAILYVFDNSQSMQAKLGAAAANQGPTTGPAAMTRWDLCRLELKQGLRGLRRDQKFNLVSFANKARSFADSMQVASKENVEQAIAWIDGLQLEFQTNAFDALELAFLLAGRGSADRYYMSEVDTLFFLSDGAPTIPKLNEGGIAGDDCDRVLAAVRRWNALGRITIHAVGIGLQNRQRERDPQGRLLPMMFLQKLAQENGGRYVARR